MHELILGGARSGKSRCAEQRTAAWLAAQPGRSALLIATAQAGDAEMAARIARHRADRAQRVPALAAVEEPLALADCIAAHAAPDRLLVVDCLTLWLTNLMLPLHGAAAGDIDARTSGLADALQRVPGPLVLVSNEIGLGVLPMSADARRFVDALGQLHQAVAARCARVTLMVAGQALALKGGA